MRSNLFLTLSAACLLTFTACQQAAEASADLAKIKSEIQAIENAWAAALNAQDLNALMTMYADDVVSMLNNAPMLVGKDAIRQQQEQEFASSPAGKTYTFEVLDVYAHGNTVTETGKATYKDAAGKVTGTGKYMVVWKKQGDTYLCIREIYNGDQTPGAENLAVVDQLYKSFAANDIPTALATMDANIVWNEAEGFPYADKNPYIGPDAVLNGVFARIGAEWEYWNLTDIQMHEMTKNKVLSTLRYKGKNKKTGKVIDAQTAHLFTLKDGKIVAFQQFTDTKQAGEALR